MLKGVFRRLFRLRLRFMKPIDRARALGAKVGENCHFVTFPNLGSEPWLIEIGNHVELSGHVTFITHDGSTWLFREDPQYAHVLRYGKIIIHDNCFIGMNSLIMPGVEIGPNSIVGAGSVVTKRVPENTVVAGNPARVICTVDEFKEKCLNCTPDYDVNAYRENKKAVVLKLLEDRMKF